jgi:hypothetical protein
LNRPTGIGPRSSAGPRLSEGGTVSPPSLSPTPSPRGVGGLLLTTAAR